ncbi:glycoside hydrolase family 53 protein [Dinghuibacter silviterrae]|uniref:Arabinogalactan endo-beta-1,4-galactanase n=1 Tax=Dinghuibacter silviterrae TaxID=1539049 RepID=A0A4V6Q9W2_9BACT|nr:glycosyl hydrolase 53 family protein [Dinghuibacter silviterrae]TDW97352.1 glycosyl hydrolase family 53 [Dinghuibacter silviterrae]
MIKLCCVVAACLLAAGTTPKAPGAHPTLDPHPRVEKVLGADISFLPQLEAEGMHFYDHGVQKDAIRLLKDNGFNYIRLRIFVHPAADSGYSPKGYCGLHDTKKMALRIKAAHLKFLLDFHYSDTWADPGKQYKPHAWRGLPVTAVADSVGAYTRAVLEALKAQGTLPDMVQVGNEINHGLLWPEGGSAHLDTLAEYLRAGIAAVREVAPKAKVMLHIACGGQNAESRYFLDNMIRRGVVFDVIGESYYPQWHGSLDDLRNNLTDLETRYHQDVIVVEYTQRKKEVNDIEFALNGKHELGTFIWEPLNTWEQFIDRNGRTVDSLIDIYPTVKKTYHIP